MSVIYSKKVTVKEILKPYYHRLQRICKFYRRIGLHNKDFSIISNNCTGGYVYQYYGVAYNTPTEGLYFTTEDYLKIIKRPEFYFKHEVELIPSQESVLAKAGRTIKHPVGKVDDIEIYFLHYPDPDEALGKWYRRCSRINYNKLFFLLTETELMRNGNVQQFSDIIEKGKNGVCLTMKNYDLPHTLYVANVPKDDNNGNAAWKPQIIISSLNWKRILNNL